MSLSSSDFSEELEYPVVLGWFIIGNEIYEVDDMLEYPVVLGWFIITKS